jgi:hypothetical protein
MSTPPPENSTTSPTQAAWNVMFYTFTDNELEVGSFRDLAKLTALNLPYPNVVVHILLETRTMGTYRIRLQGDPYSPDAMTMQRLPTVDMSKCETLVNFLTQSYTEPAAHHALILGGHGSGWLLITEGASTLPVARLRECLEQANVHLDLVCFDNCLMSNVSSAYELRNVTDYIVAYEDYAGYDGVIEQDMLRHFNDVSLLPQQVAIYLAQSVLDAINGKRVDPTDVSVISTQHLGEFGDFLRSICPLTRPNTKADCIDPTYWQLQDLWEIVQATLSAKPTDLDKFKTLFNQVVVFYKQSWNKHNPRNHGLSCIVDPEKDTFDKQHSWKLLQLQLSYK